MDGAAVLASSVSDAPARAGVWRSVSYGYALLIAAALVYFVLGIPIQLWDVLGDLFDLMDQSVWGVVVKEMTGTQFMRPLARVQFKLAYELAGGVHYFLVFKAFHVAQIIALTLLFVRLLRVRSRADALVVPVGLALLFGAHIFLGHVDEAFPLNNYLTAVVASLAAADLALSPYAWWRGPAAILLFAFAALTIESGLLVWVCLVAAWMVGGRGVSVRTLGVVTLLLALYVVARVTFLQAAAPLLSERPSGFGFRVLEPSELVARFGDSQALFYAYNVASQILTVLFSEPRGGVWALVRDYVAGATRPSQWIGLVTSAGATLMIGWYVATRLRAWLRRDFTHADRVVFVAGAVLVANAVISFAYLKDVIVGPASAFHALAAAIALRALLPRLSAWRPPLMVAASLVIFVISAGSIVRLVGTCFLLRERAFVTRNDWALFEDEWAVRNRFDINTADPRKVALVRRLRDDAIGRRTPAPHFAQGRSDDWFR
jgi:hypothetical protein